MEDSSSLLRTLLQVGLLDSSSDAPHDFDRQSVRQGALPAKIRVDHFPCGRDRGPHTQIQEVPLDPDDPRLRLADSVGIVRKSPLNKAHYRPASSIHEIVCYYSSDQGIRITLLDMRHSPQPSQDRPLLTSYFWSGDAIRSRRVSDIVLSGTVDIPEPPARLRADWAREISSGMTLDPGDVEVMPLARARVRWPDYSRCVQAVSDWTSTLGLSGVLASGDIALMACRGARYHHDGDQYGGAAFCNLFLSEDKGQDVHFPSLGLRIPLRRGTVLIFDTCQPHGVIQRGSTGFDVADFPSDQDCTQLFLTWELPIEDARIGQALNVAFDTDPSASMMVHEEHVRLNGERVSVCHESGEWRRAD